MEQGELSATSQSSLEVIAATCGMLHDLGNPPFGHAGEQAVCEWQTALSWRSTARQKKFQYDALVIAKNGPKLQEAMPGDTYPNGFKDDHGRPIGAGIFQTGSCKLAGQGVPIADLVGALSERLGRSVVDETGLKGNYDLTFDCFAPLRTPESEPSLLKAVPEHAEALTKVHAIETASLLEAVSEQLGLELSVQTVPVEILVIDHAEKPSEN